METFGGFHDTEADVGAKMGALAESDLLLQRFYRWEREKAGRIFLTQPYDGGNAREWTWARTGEEVRRMAAYLQARDWPPGSRVGILSKNCAWWIMADLAIWMSGHVSVPVYPSLKADSVRRILEHSECRACFIGATDQRESALNGVPEGVVRIYFPNAPAGSAPVWDSLMYDNPPMAESPVRAASDLATIIYTSGTTGIPKGVMHNFAAFRHQTSCLAPALAVSGEQRILSYLPLAHIVERCGVENLAVSLGWRLYFSEGLDTFIADLRRAQPTIFISVPRLLAKFQQGVFAKVPKAKLERLLRFPLVNFVVKRRILRQLGLHSVRKAACGAAPLPAETLLWYRRLGLNLVEGYGMTEAMITHLSGKGCIRPGYVGRPLHGVEAKLGANGELLLRSPMNMIGYYKDPQGAINAFTEDGFFRTGDLAVIEKDGQLKIVGRIKEQFKTSKGKYVAPAPIESKLMAHPDVEGCCIIGAGLPSPFALVALSPEAKKRCADPDAQKAIELQLGTLLKEVNAGLDPHERVMFIAIVAEPWTIENGVLTPTLKVRRNELERRYLELPEEWKTQGKPVVWEAALGKVGGLSIAP